MDWTFTDLLYRALYAILVFGAGYLVAGWLSGLIAMMLERTSLDPIVRRLAVSIVRPTIIILSVFAAVSVLGIEMTSFAAVAGAVTLAVGMSMQGSLSNVASGALLLTLRPFNADDVITAAGHTGKVKTLKLFATVLETPDGNTVTLPNDAVFKSPIVTFTTTPNSRVDVAFTVQRDADIEKVATILRDVLTEDERTLEDPPVSVTFNGVTDLGIEIVGKAWAANADKWGLRSDATAEILKRLQKSKIALATRAQ